MRSVQVAAGKLGVPHRGVGAFDPEAKRFDELADAVARSGADGVVLGADPFIGGDRLLKALRERSEHESRSWPASSSPTSPMCSPRPGRRPRDVRDHDRPATRRARAECRAAERFARELRRGRHRLGARGGARRRSSWWRRSPAPTARAPRCWRSCRRAEVKDGMLGSFRFDRNGDITPATMPILRITGSTPPEAGLPSTSRAPSSTASSRSRVAWSAELLFRRNQSPTPEFIDDYARGAAGACRRRRGGLRGRYRVHSLRRHPRCRHVLRPLRAGALAGSSGSPSPARATRQNTDPSFNPVQLTYTNGDLGGYTPLAADGSFVTNVFMPSEFISNSSGRMKTYTLTATDREYTRPHGLCSGDPGPGRRPRRSRRACAATSAGRCAGRSSAPPTGARIYAHWTFKGRKRATRRWGSPGAPAESHASVCRSCRRDRAAGSGRSTSHGASASRAGAPCFAWT